MKQVSLPDWSDCKSTVVKKVEVVDPSKRFVFHGLNLLKFYKLYHCCCFLCFPQNFKSEVLLFLWSLTQHQVRNFESVHTMKAIVIFSSLMFFQSTVQNRNGVWFFHQCRPVARKVLQPRHYFKTCARIEFLWIASSISCSLTLVVL